MTAEDRYRAMFGPPTEHPLEAPLRLTDEELEAARRSGVSLLEAEARKAEALARRHGLTPAQVRACVALGIEPATYAGDDDGALGQRLPPGAGTPPARGRGPRPGRAPGCD